MVKIINYKRHLLTNIARSAAINTLLSMDY